MFQEYKLNHTYLYYLYRYDEFKNQTNVMNIVNEKLKTTKVPIIDVLILNKINSN